MDIYLKQSTASQVVIKVLARCTVRMGSENVIDRVFNNADAQTERRRLGVKNTHMVER